MSGECVHRQFLADECPQDLDSRGVGQHPEDLNGKINLLSGQRAPTGPAICIYA
jgi:hypothetical protein